MRILALVVMLAMAGLSVGCVSGNFGSKVSQQQKEAVVKGKTTTVDVLREMGNPDQRIDLGGGKTQFSYISSKVSASPLSVFGDLGASDNTEYWIVFQGDVVEDFGERPTSKDPNYFK